MPGKLFQAGQRPLKTLERVFSKAGAGSRTDARSWIGTGRVRVNGKVIRNPDHWVDLERDKVTLDGKLYIDQQDTHISGAGSVGVWTKADSVTAFDDFSSSGQ